jgi:cyclic pyranopterin monophosphate synthase
VEAMHAASITALTIYDMLKPIDKNVEISAIKLEQKKGGKTDVKDFISNEIKTAVIVCSTSVSEGTSQDRSGLYIVEKLKEYSIAAECYKIIPDQFELIQSTVKQLSEEEYQLILCTGGTGLSPQDVTPDAILPLLDKQIPGIMEASRHYGQQRMPFAMLSRGVSGFLKNSLVITLPGSPNAVKECMDVLFPYVLHVFKVAEGYKHD